MLYNTTLGVARDAIKKAKALIGSSKPVIALLSYYSLCLEFSINNVEYLLSSLSIKTKID